MQGAAGGRGQSEAGAGEAGRAWRARPKESARQAASEQDDDEQGDPQTSIRHRGRARIWIACTKRRAKGRPGGQEQACSDAPVRQKRAPECAPEHSLGMHGKFTPSSVLDPGSAVHTKLLAAGVSESCAAVSPQTLPRTLRSHSSLICSRPCLPLTRSPHAWPLHLHRF